MSVNYTVKKGDTLNGIAKQYGYANYKEAGVSSVPSGNFDLIRPGETITLNNYDPGTASTVKSGSPVVSSSDRTQEYKDMSSELDGKSLNAKDIPDDTGTSDSKTGADSTASSTTGDKVYDAYLQDRANAKAEAEAWKIEQQKQIEKLLPQTLALLNAEYKASTLNIKSVYEKLIDSQVQINRLDVDRVKAYGLQNGGQYMPLEFTNAVSMREKQGASEIARLENERNSLIAKAKSARDEGRINAQRDSMKALREVEDAMRTRVKDLLDEVTTRYELTEKAREKKEAEHKVAVEKALKRATVMYLDDYEQAKDPEAQATLIQNIIKESNGALTDEDYYDIYSGLSGASASATDRKLKLEKAELDIANTKNTIYNRDRNTDSLIANRNKEKDEESDLNSDFTTNVIDGVSSLSDFDGTEYEKVKSDLNELGYYSEEVPEWYIEGLNTSTKSTVTPEEVQRQWDEHRKKVTSEANNEE